MFQHGSNYNSLEKPKPGSGQIQVQSRGLYHLELTQLTQNSLYPNWLGAYIFIYLPHEMKKMSGQNDT